MGRSLAWPVLLLVVAGGCATPRPARDDLPEIITELPGRPRPAVPSEPSTPDGPPRRPIEPARDGRGGFGSGTIGGAGGRRIRVTDATEEAVRHAIDDANRTGRAVIEFAVPRVIAIHRPLPRVTAPWVTIDGNGTTLDGQSMVHRAGLLDIRTHDVIVENLRLRNGYDNLRIQGAQAASIVVRHVSSTGAEDDGISISGGAHDVTVEWSFLAGNTRSVFCKYLGTTRLSIHHTWIQKGWIRNPLFQGAMLADVRNVIIEDWGLWGMRFQDGAGGNVVGSLFILSPAARAVGGKPDSALRLQESGAVFVDGNVFRGADAVPGLAPAAVRAAPVATQSVEVMEPQVRARAGCQPRDRVDAAYIALAPGWTIGRETPLRVRP